MLYPENELKSMTEYCGGMEGPMAADWMKDMILYEVYIRNATPEGTFRAFISRLKDIKDMGFTAIWLMPVHPIGRKKRKGSLGCPYSLTDYMDVNPEYGSKEDFRELVQETHRLGMKFFIDMVANHTAHDNVYIEEHPDWFQRDDTGMPTRREAGWSDVIDNDYRSPQFRVYMKKALEYWIREFDIDGYRCDVAGMVPLDFWEEVIYDLRKLKPDIYMLAEWEYPALCRKAFNSDYNLALYYCMRKLKKGERRAMDLVELTAARRKMYPLNYLPLNYTENHDQKRASKVFGRNGMKPYGVYVFTIPGIPLIYNGQETGETRYLSLFEKKPYDVGNGDGKALEFYRDLIKLRKEYPVFRLGEVIPLVNNRPEDIASYLLKYRNETVMVLLNFSSRRVSLEVNLPRYIHFGDGEKIYSIGKTSWSRDVKGEKMKVTLPSQGYLILKDG